MFRMRLQLQLEAPLPQKNCYELTDHPERYLCRSDSEVSF